MRHNNPLVRRSQVVRSFVAVRACGIFEVGCGVPFVFVIVSASQLSWPEGC